MNTLDWPLRRAATLFPARCAVVDGSHRLTYAQLHQRAAQLGAGLRGRGVGRGDRVAVLMANSHRYLELHFAVPGIGAALVPLNTRLSTSELAVLLRDCEPRLLVADDENRATAEALAPVVGAQVVGEAAYEELLAERDPADLTGPVSEDDMAGIYYTGGTTGLPKGVVLTHRNLLSATLFSWLGLELADEEVFLYTTPLFHLAAVGSVFGVTWTGGCHVVLSGFDPAAVLRMIAEERVTSLGLVPIMMRMLMDTPTAAVADLSSLKVIAHGGAPIDPSLCAEASRFFGCSLLQAYGMTEAAPILTVLPREETLLDDPRIRSAGRPVLGVEIEVRGPKGERREPGAAGEVWARGPNITPGYWQRAQETAEALVYGWLRTGDVGYVDEEGFLYLVDRLKDMVVSGGENVYCGEVELVLADHPDVAEVAVIGVPDPTWGERVHAVVVARSGTHPADDDLVAHCRARLAGFKVPRSIEVRPEPLPRSALGKVLKRDLRAPHWAGTDRGIS